MLAGEQEALTDVIVGAAGGVPPLPPLLLLLLHPTTHNDPRIETANKVLHVIPRLFQARLSGGD